MNKITPQNKTILDPCCGARMFWFNKNDERAVFGDIRNETKQLCDGRTFKVQPDQIMDFRNLPYADNCFDLVVFDPPHLIKVGINSWMASKYGHLDKQTWRDDIRAGFSEAFRVLKPRGTLVFKWAEKDITVSEILKLTPVRPAFGHKSGKRMRTHWISFLKDGREGTKQLCDGRTLNVRPDQITSFRNLPYSDNCFDLVVFDPPHLSNVGINSWIASKYGRLDEQTWPDDIRAGFSEAFRVLKPNGNLVFTWAEKDIAVSEILKLTPVRPVIGHKSGKQMGTHWILFLKDGDAA